METIEELYKAQQSALGVDKISWTAGKHAQTPYTTDDLKKADEQVLTAEKFKVGRGGSLNEKKYSDTFKK